MFLLVISLSSLVLSGSFVTESELFGQLLQKFVILLAILLPIKLLFVSVVF